jgi:DNA-binding response OmpR family regulator
MPFHILIVDDNDLNLALVSKILKLEGYHVTKAHNGEDAIRAIMQYMPDLAILDVIMPDINGYELCRRIRQDPLNVKSPIVMLTAMSPEMERAEALEAGANDIWSKPFDLETFRKRVGDLLQTKPVDSIY